VKNSVFLTDEHREKLVIKVINAKSADKRLYDYKLLKQYNVLTVQYKNKLTFLMKDEGNFTLYYAVPDSELFDALHTTHVSNGHSG
jgi:hypothetical protein